jgi:hypothetical protein
MSYYSGASSVAGPANSGLEPCGTGTPVALQNTTRSSALESSRPERRRLFQDPLARAFLTWPFAIVIRLAVIPGFRELVPWVIDNRWPGGTLLRGRANPAHRQCDCVRPRWAA